MEKLSHSRYTSQFDNWDEQSWTRYKPRRNQPFEPDKYFFSKQLSPLLQHPVVSQSSDEVVRKLLVYDLFRYLDFTKSLEMGPVNQVCGWLAGPNFLPWLPQQMKDDALRIYVDEAGHAEMSNTLIRDVVNYTRLRPLNIPLRFLDALHQIKTAWPSQYSVALQLMSVIVSETLITGSLRVLPKDIMVQQRVRLIASDHASDEGRHHSYFKQLFSIIWQRIPFFFRVIIVKALPDMIRAFLAPDAVGLKAALDVTNYDFGIPNDAIIDELMQMEVFGRWMAHSAQPIMKMLESHGVFEIDGTSELFDEFTL